MKVVGVCGINLSFAVAIAAYSFACSAAGAAADISGTYWATSYSPKIEVLGGGDPPLNAAGKAAYEMNQKGLKDGSSSTRRAMSACPTACRACSPRPILSKFSRCRPVR